MYSLNEIRKSFLDFFESKDHYVNKSYSLVPENDKSLLLINAGMAPLKKYFTGEEIPPNRRMATCQKCMRTGDIDNVGHTDRHATYFEMLGNFSFGDYFKEESLKWGYEYFTEVLKLDKDKLWASVYETDDEAYNIWKDIIKIDENKIVRLGKEDNFWEKGTGPCGPCSEIYYDRGAEHGCGSPDCKPGCDCDRYMEVWNHVFTQYDKDEEGNYNNLSNPNIDTGMGLERIACVMQNVSSIFEIDTIKILLNKVMEVTNTKENTTSVRIITDHIRAITFMISDGIMPNNEGRGYVLRKIIRRAYRHGKLLGMKDVFLYQLVDTVIDINKDAYPELLERKEFIKKVLKLEEERFQATIEQGFVILKKYIDELKGDMLSGESAFKLYDTYGFPLDLTKEILVESNKKVDEEEFNKYMLEQKERARNARDNSSAWGKNIISELDLTDTEFLGYTDLESSSTIIAIIKEEEALDALSKEDENVQIILDRTPFYAESGGQVGDKGIIKNDEFEFVVENTVKSMDKFVHIGRVNKGFITKGAEVQAVVDKDYRLSNMRNHTATHLLHQALRDVLGEHVEQKGSLVEAKRLRFDFSHMESISQKDIRLIENIVNEKILSALDVNTSISSVEEAKKAGARALFGEKYGDEVRVVSIDDYSVELCGGTHVKNTGSIGMFKIVSESGIASGVRRIEAITAKEVINYMNERDHLIDSLNDLLNTNTAALEDKVQSTIEELKSITKELQKEKANKLLSSVDDIIKTKETINEFNVIIKKIENVDMDGLRTLGDDILARSEENTIIVLASVLDDKVNLLSLCDKKAIANNVHCGKLIKEIASVTKGGGGGRPNMAQAGGKDITKVDEALELAYEIIRKIS